MHAQVTTAKAFQRVFPTTVASYLTFHGSVRQEATGNRQGYCRLADVISSAAGARRGGVRGQQCDISGDFVAGSIWLLLQQRWLTEQALGERNYETRR